MLDRLTEMPNPPKSRGFQATFTISVGYARVRRPEGLLPSGHDTSGRCPSHQSGGVDVEGGTPPQLASGHLSPGTGGTELEPFLGLSIFCAVPKTTETREVPWNKAKEQ